MKKTKEKIPPREYSNILKGLSLKQIYLEACSSNVNKKEFTSYKQLAITVTDRASFKQDDEQLIVTHKYFLTARKEENAEDKKHFLFKISVTFTLFFSSEINISKDFFDIFKRRNLPVNSWPYFREFVQSMTQRMNIPPVTLPFFHTP